MLKQVRNNLFYFYKNSIKSILLFWSIYLFFIGVLVVITFLAGGSAQFVGVNIIPSFIFTIVFSILFFKDTFPFVIKYGTNRHSYFISLVVFTILYSIGMTLLSLLTTTVIVQIIEIFNINNFSFLGLHESFHIPVTMMEVSIFEALLYGVFFFLSSCIAVVFYRFGYLLGAIFIAPFIAMFFFPKIVESLIEIGKFFAIGHDQYNVGAYFILYAIFSLILWLLMRNASILDKTR